MSMSKHAKRVESYLNALDTTSSGVVKPYRYALAAGLKDGDPDLHADDIRGLLADYKAALLEDRRKPVSIKNTNDAREVVCPRCHAQPNHACHSVSSFRFTVLKKIHRERVNLAIEQANSEPLPNQQYATDFIIKVSKYDRYAVFDKETGIRLSSWYRRQLDADRHLKALRA